MFKRLFLVWVGLLVFHFTMLYGETTTYYQDTIAQPDAIIFPGPVSSNLSVFEIIQGRVAGVWVTGSYPNYQIRVRNAQRPPLVVIDGMYFTGYTDQQISDLLESISIMDIDRIEVYKGAASGVLYPNSGNGVLVIVTKPG